MKQLSIVLALLLSLSVAVVSAQWPKFSAKDLPRNPDGTVNMDAPTPKAADGKPDLSGVWEIAPPARPAAAPAPVAATGTGEAPPPGSRSS